MRRLDTAGRPAGSSGREGVVGWWREWSREAVAGADPGACQRATIPPYTAITPTRLLVQSTSMSPRRVDRQPIVRTTVSDGETLSVVVCDLMSRVTDTPIRELPPLATAIDPDALDAVFDGKTTEGSVAFQYADHDLVVRSNGDVEVYPVGTATE